MTQALNLANFANNLNASGATSNTGLQNSAVTVNTTSPIAGGGAVVLGSALTLTHANSGVSANTYTAATITVNSSGHITAASSNTVASGTVTSVATGNGLSGGTITSSGTLSIACPTFNTVGSYAMGYIYGPVFVSGAYYVNAGSNYAAGASYLQIFCSGYGVNSNSAGAGIQATNELSGTWKWMGSSQQISNGYGGGDGWGGNSMSVVCRVS